MYSYPSDKEKAILVQVFFPGVDNEQNLAEFKELACAANAQVLNCLLAVRDVPDSKYFIGTGKAEELRQVVQEHTVGVVLVNHDLSPSQERNLEKLVQCRVIDRTGLILDIFAQRARTFEGKLQVELAQLQYLSTRLIRGWTHLERQKGGIGLRGPGETQLETDRRLIRARITKINQLLEKVKSNREQNRKARLKSAVPVVSLVGYTNAGKSTLFNSLTGDTTYVANKLFATLDPTVRKLMLPAVGDIMLIDTVGFIRDLPHKLVKAFHATLEETTAADLLLHVINIADPDWRDLVHAVERVLVELKVDHIPIINIFNKIDLHADWQARYSGEKDNYQVWLSAKTGDGIDLLKQIMAKQLSAGIIGEEEISLSADQGKLRAELYKHHFVIAEKLTENGWKLKIRATKNQKQRLFKNFNNNDEVE